MNRNEAISGLVNYALEKEMIQPEEKAWAVNGHSSAGCFILGGRRKG